MFNFAMVRAGLLAGLLLILAACGREDAREAGAPGDLPASLSPRFYPPQGWAWGSLEQAKPQRYGVASTPRVPTATIVILPGYGEPAEVWFETASDLVEAGHTVWILDRAGQGGSARYAKPADLGFVPSFAVERDGLQSFLSTIVKPRPQDVVILLAHADAAAVALDAIGSGVKVDGLIASAAELSTTRGSPWLGTIQRPDAPPFGWRPWTRDQPDDRAAGRTHDPARGRLRQVWLQAKPELRLSSPSLGWLRAFDDVSRALAEAGLSTPTMMVNPNHPAAALCRKNPACHEHTIPGARQAIHLEADQWRGPWLAMIDDFISQRFADRQTAVSAATPTP